MDMFTENDAHSTMLTMIFHARLLAQVVKCVAEFSLADHLSGEPRSPESVAEAAGLDREATYRLLRYCSVVGLASAEGDGRYRETPLLATLRSDDPLFLRSFALAQVSSHADGGESHPALSSRRVGSYTFQAAIASVHADAPNAAATDWAQIAGLYDVLVYVEPSPVVELNRAVAVAKRNGPDAGLALIDAILARGDLADYHLAHAARADLCRQLGRTAETRASYERALTLARQEPERRFLERRLAELG
jgi:hypothetical protein